MSYSYTLNTVALGPWTVALDGGYPSIGTMLAPGASITLTGVGETLYALGDPTAVSPNNNFALSVVAQFT